MANVAKYTRSATGQLCQHYERKQIDGEYIKFGNQDIDLSKTDQNYNLAPHREGGQINFIKLRLSEVKFLKRDNVNVMCSWVVTLPKSYPITHEREFFEHTYRFLAERYGEKNVVSAYVHKDENRPHIHFAFIPVTIGKDGKEKVSAKEVLTKAELKAFHPALQRYLEQYLEYEVEILNGATIGGNRTMHELKAEKEIQRYEALCEKYKKQLDELAEEKLDDQAKIHATHNELNSLQSQKKAVQAEIGALQGKLLSTKEVNAIQGKKAIMGNVKGVSYEDYEALKRTAVHVQRIARERDTALEKAATAMHQAEAAEQRAKEALEKQPSIQMQLENTKLLGQLGRLKNRLKSIYEYLPEHLRPLVQKIIADREPFGKSINSPDRCER